MGFIRGAYSREGLNPVLTVVYLSRSDLLSTHANGWCRDENKWLNLGDRKRTTPTMIKFSFDLFITHIPIKFISKFLNEKSCHTEKFGY